MGYTYNGKQVINNTLKLNGHAPIDQRTVIDNVADVYISVSNQSACSLFKNAYKGMVVSTFDADGNVVILSLKNDAPYRVDNTTLSVTADNYLDYWTEISENAISAEITAATYFQGGDMADTMETLVKHGCLPARTTIADLESMTISDIIKAILFEVVEPTRDASSGPKATISWQNYTPPREVGTELPTSANINLSFTSDIYKNIASTGEVLNTFSLNKLNRDNSQFYYGTTTGDINVDMSSEDYTAIKNGFVQEGTFYVRAVASFDKNQDATNSVGAIKVPGYAGTVAATPANISFVGAYKVLSNALHQYTNKSTAWSKVGIRETKDSTGWVDTTINYQDTVAAPLVTASGVTVYYKWPSGTNASDVFKVYVPSGYRISSVKVASDTATDTYNTDWQFTKTSQTRNDIKTSTQRGANATYEVYTITKADSMTNVEVKIIKN